ncbi:ATPase [Nocardia sp. MDA0666]|uniref:SRPBCC family protein n=1 Tax=Nocardia sp. MDA0666 TaxID=2135448 RepID=UPI000D11F9D8|nr:SRPBCC domain-containing protein [Nocardia sp. MDA0666]PSR69695.1 ATPase [Nocardia sp. MDA0666]
MTEQNFSTTFAVDRTPETFFDAVLDVRGWWSKTLTGRSEKPGDVFTYEVPGVHRATIEVTEVVPHERVVWRVLDARLTLVDDRTEWNGTTIRFEITRRTDITELRFTHVGLTPAFECFDVCRKGWSFYIDTSLHDLIATGTGQPDEDPQALALANAAPPHKTRA